MTAIGTSCSGTDAKATFGKIEAVADGPTNAVELHPLYVRLVHPALVDEILDQSTDGVISERSHDRRIHPEAALQTARNVILAAAFPNLEVARGRDASLTRIETQHDLAETNDVPATMLLFFDDQIVHRFLATKRHKKHKRRHKKHKSYFSVMCLLCLF